MPDSLPGEKILALIDRVRHAEDPSVQHPALTLGNWADLTRLTDRNKVLERELAEMTQCRDAAVRQGERAEVNLDFDLEEAAYSAVEAMNYDWEYTDGLPPTELVNSIVAHVRPDLARLTERLKQAYTLLAELVDTEDCWFDHHGGCQAHGYLSLEQGEKCPQFEVKELLKW